jgi:anhydro-N-acetylmuramic acid kinase
MNSNITRLAKIAGKKSRLIIGLMSGTSLDGLDVALCRISGSGLSTKVDLLKFQTVPYNSEFKSRILQVFAKRQIDFQSLCELNASIALLHGDVIVQCLKKWNYASTSIDIVASHGQTVFHSPRSITPKARINSTLQIGDGDHLAVKTGIITISDFRQKHVAKGGEGAPLAVYGDYLLFSKKGEDRLMLNLGGIGNFTYLPGTMDASKVFVTDTGPANTLLDQAVRLYRPDIQYDRDSLLAKKGTYNQELLKALKADMFFNLPFPKTIGPELFNMEYVLKAQRASGTESLSLEDLLATLTRLSAETIAIAIKKVIKNKKSFRLFLSGGGAHNPLMIQWVKEFLPSVQFNKMDDLGISGDAKEAVLFAVLANEALAGGRLHFGNRSKVPSVSMGKISFPN